MKKIIIASTVIMAWLAVASAQAATHYGYAQPPMWAAQTEQPGPAQVLREGMGKLLKFMRQPQRPSQQVIAAFLQHEIAPYFDFAYMSTWVAGPMNRRMNDAQRAELAQAIEQLLLSTLANRLASFQNQDVRFYPPRQGGENEVKVRMAILQANGYPANLDFRFYRSKGGWKVFDVAANGSSALTYYRQHFSRRMATYRPRPQG
jgi:phospholipid transport system substrate-binding protein